MLRKFVRNIPPLHRAYRAIKEFTQRDEATRALYKKVFERGRLMLPEIAPEALLPETMAVEFPAFHPFFAGEDAPLIDLLFLLSIAKGRNARRILEVGTYRGRTTFALHQNCPEAEIVSYDIQILPSRYRAELEQSSRVKLRNASFSASARSLRQEEPFDFIFIDGAHDVDSVLADSELAFQILDSKGVILWHDYRLNGYSTRELRVPEALNLIKRDKRLFHVRATTCAIYSPELVSISE